MAARINNLSIEQLDELIKRLDSNIESMKELKALEQQMTQGKRADVRLSAVIHSMEEQRTGYHALRTRKTIIGR